MAYYGGYTSNNKSPRGLTQAAARIIQAVTGRYSMKIRNGHMLTPFGIRGGNQTNGN